MAEAETLTPPPVAAAAPRRTVAVLGILIGLALGALDATITSTAMPSIIASLGGVHLYFLPTAVFMVCATATTPVWGRLLDVYGRRVFHLIGVIIFLAGSALCGQADSMIQLTIFRGVQGIGAGALLPVSFTMVADLYPIERRAKMQGLVAAVWGVCSIIGPLAGAAITKYLSWRWVFYVNIPIGIVSTAMVQSVWSEPAHGRTGRRVDALAAALTLLGAGAFMVGCAIAGRVGFDPTSLACFAGAVAATTLLLLVERRAPDPFISYELFRIPLFSRGVACGAFGAIALFCATTYITLYMQGVLGHDELGSGAVLIPMTFGWVLMSGVGGQFTHRVGYRRMATAGMAAVTVAYALLATLPAAPSWMRVAAPMALLGAGLGGVLTPLLIGAQNAVPAAKLGAATSLTQFTRTMTGAVGVAFAGLLLSGKLSRHLPPGRHPDEIINPIARRALAPEVVESIRAPLDAGLHQVFWVGLAAGILGFLVALALPRGSGHDLADHAQRG